MLWHNSKVPLKKTFWMLFHVFFGMTVTFVVFPGVTDATSVEFLTNRAWFELFIVTMFNVFDTIGRYLGGMDCLMVKSDGPGIHLVSFGRVAGIAVAILIMMKVITADWVVAVNIVLFALTNGYVQTISCVYAASKVDETHS